MRSSKIYRPGCCCYLTTNKLGSRVSAVSLSESLQEHFPDLIKPTALHHALFLPAVALVFPYIPTSNHEGRESGRRDSIGTFILPAQSGLIQLISIILPAPIYYHPQHS